MHELTCRRCGKTWAAEHAGIRNCPKCQEPYGYPAKVGVIIAGGQRGVHDHVFSRVPAVGEWVVLNAPSDKKPSKFTPNQPHYRVLMVVQFSFPAGNDAEVYVCEEDFDEGLREFAEKRSELESQPDWNEEVGRRERSSRRATGKKRSGR